MSGDARRARNSRAAGWEEAGGEFYQELYPGGEQELLEPLQRADAKRLATLLPSKQARNTTTVKRPRPNDRRQSTFARTTQSRDIHLSMLPDLSENLSNEERTWEEMMLIKAMPVPMAQKIELKATLQNATKLRLQGLEQFQWRQRKRWHRFKIRSAEFMGKLTLWQSSLRQIESNFGTGVVSYFLFLRWLLFLNLAISILVIIFLIVPKMILREVDSCKVNTTCCAKAYFNRSFLENSVPIDLLQGTGVMEKTILFYGVYSDQTYTYKLESLFHSEMYYNMPLAYILVPISWALFSLIAIVKSGAKGFKERLIESEGQFYKYCNTVFGGWDYCIHNEKSAKIKHRGLYNEIKGTLEQEKYIEEVQSRSREARLILFLKRFFINIVVFVILVACGVFIYIVFNFSMDTLNSDKEKTHTNGTFSNNWMDFGHFKQFKTTVFQFLPFLTIVLLNIIIPGLFGWLIKMENYTPSKEIIVTLLRTVLLRLSSLAVLLSQIYIRITENNMECSANVLENSVECWETYVGQQLYKLMLTDFAVQFITIFFINLPRAFIARHTHSRCFKVLGEQHFYLPKHVLDIVYTQTIIWMGTFYCPFLPLIGTVFCFLMFYMKKFTCLVNCTPSPILYKASKSKGMFVSVLFLGFVLSIAPVAYAIGELNPSVNCGPFRDKITVWSFMKDMFNHLPYVVREFVFFVGTSKFAVPTFAVLLLTLYYYWAVASANRHMVGVLKNQLVLEGHDKQFLLNRLSAFIRQHQKKCERRNRASFADDESTARQCSR